MILLILNSYYNVTKYQLKMLFIFLIVLNLRKVSSWELSTECRDWLDMYCNETINKAVPFVFGTDCFMFHYFSDIIRNECDHD